MSTIVAAGPSVYGLGPAPQVGEELYERELIRRLPAQGIRVVVGMPRDHHLEATAGVHIAPLPRPAGLHWITAPLLFVPWTVALLAGRRVDVLRAASVRYAGPSLVAARWLCRSRVPVVIHHHHFEPRWRGLEAAIIRRADLVFTVSEHSRRDLESAGIDPARIRVVHNGIDGPPARNPEPPSTWPGGGLRLLSLGRLESRKRPSLAIDTLAELLRGGDDASLALAGDGPERQALESRAGQLGVADRVRFLGRVSDERKWQLYDGAQLLLFGSTKEGFGLVVAEGQSRGLPAVAGAGTATVEAFDPGQSGLLAEPRSDAFAAAVREILAPGRLSAMADAAAAFGARFSWERCSADVARGLREAVDAGARECTDAGPYPRGRMRKPGP